MKRSALLLSISFLLGTSQSASASVQFTDDTFNDADWSASIILEYGPPASFDAQQVSTGGNPGAYRRVDHTYGGPGGIRTAHLLDGAVYHPASQGAISSVVFSFDLILFDGGESNVVAYGGLILQNGSYYRSAHVLTPGDDDLYRWESGYQLELLASDFILDSGTGPEHPDFSAGGGPIQFGFFASNGTANASQTSTSSGIDNWSVTLDRTPLPSIPRRGMVLLSLLLVALASWSMKRGATREAA